MKWYWWIICIIIIIGGVFCAIDGYKLLTAKSATYGTYEYIPNVQTSIFEEKLTGIVFETEDDKVYTATKLFETQSFDGNAGDYELLINNLPCYSQKVSSGKIEGTFKMDFKNAEGEIISSANVKVTVSFMASNTVIDLVLENENNSIFMFEQFIDNNGLDIKIVENLEVENE